MKHPSAPYSSGVDSSTIDSSAIGSSANAALANASSGNGALANGYRANARHARRTGLATFRTSAIALALAALGAGNARAADTAAAPAAAASTDTAPLDAIVVTAQRRSENIKDVPISISVLSGDDIAAQRISNVEDLSRAIPGLSFNSWGGTEELTNIVIRGVSSTSGSATVGLYLDDVSITTKNLFDPGSAQPRLYDLDHIEVLRGPQGTLWGDSSEGGTVRYLTEKPNLHEFSSTVTADVSDTKHGGTNYLSSAVVNLPIKDGVFAVRGSVGYSHDSGYIDNYSQSGQLLRKGVNTDGALTVHLVGKLVAGSDLTITPALFYQRDVAGDNSAFYVGPAPNASFVPGLWQQSKRVNEFGTDTVWLPSLTVTKGLGFADLTSVTGLYVREYDRQEDGTFYNSYLFATAFLDPLPAFAGNSTVNDSVIGNLRSPVEFSSHYRQISQEVRLSSLPEGRARTHLQWVGGLYYADQWIHNTNFQQIPGIDATFQGIYGSTLENNAAFSSFYPLDGATTYFPNSIDESDNRTYREQQYAVFGQADYDVLPTLHAGLGARYATSKENYDSTEIGFYQIGNISPYYQTASYQAFTPKASLSFDAAENATLYASVGKGFRLGGPTGPIVFGPTSVCAGDFAAINQTTQPTHFGSDSLWTYELGSKGSVANNRINFNVAAFVTQWANIQQSLYLPTCGYYFTANVGDAKIYGAELEASYRPVSSLKFALSAGAQHAVITNTTNAVDVPVGSRLIDVPNGTYTASVNYNTPLNGEFTLRSRTDYAWTGHSFGSYQPGNANYFNPSYGVLNASLTLAASKYEVSLYAKNLNNDQKIIQSPQINTVVEGYTVRPRTIGLTGRYFF
jgi:outer membrane receptor protein involved in Fe transport